MHADDDREAVHPAGRAEDRDDVRLLRLLAKRDARAVAEPDGAKVRIELGGATPRILEVVAPAAIEGLAKAGWLAREHDAWRVTKKGRIALKRSLSRCCVPAADVGSGARAAAPAARLPSVAKMPPSAAPCESPLDWLHRRRDRNGELLITDEQFAAGERLRADHWFAGLAPRVTANWSVVAPCSRGGAGSAGELADNALAARERVNRALSAVGPELAGVLVDVCCHLRGLEQVEQQNGWALRSAKVVLQLALTALARHYGLLPSPGSHGRTRHWGVPGFRPDMGS